MTKEEIIEMAEQAGCHVRNGHIYNQYTGSLDQMLKRFAKLIAEKEREECAELIPPQYFHFRDWIRARGQE